MADSVIPADMLAKLPRTVREQLPTLPREKQERFLAEFQKRKKNLLVAWLLALLYGLHFIYLSDASSGIWFWFTVGGFFVWWIIEIIRVPRKVSEYNSMAALTLIAEVNPSPPGRAF